MSNKRPLTPEEREAAAALRRAWKDSGKSQETVGAEVGVSQGRVGHWMNARDPVPLDKAGALAKSLGIDDPGTICPLWRVVMGRHKLKDEWPFGISQSRWSRLSPEEKDHIEKTVAAMIMGYEAERFSKADQEKFVGGVREDRARRRADGKKKELK